MPVSPVAVVARLVAGLLLFRAGVGWLGALFRGVAGTSAARAARIVGNNRFAAVTLGALATACVLSSGAVTAMVVQVTGAGLISLETGICLVLGANVGTTLTAHLVALDIHRHSPGIIAAGIALGFVARWHPRRWRRRARFLGGSLAALGLVLSGMAVVSDAVAPVVASPTVMEWVSTAAGRPVLGVIVGALATAVAMSSGLTTGLVVAMCARGSMGLDGAIPLVLGANIGTCATAVLAACGSGPAARRVAAAHLAFNVLSAAVCLCCLGPFTALVALTGSTAAARAANAHSLFNLIGLALALPAAGPVTRLLEARVR